MRAGVAVLSPLLASRPCAAELCLPALAEHGRRLHEMPAPSVYWLELLLRQHEACWTADAPHEQLRVFLYGNSSVLGHPERAEDTAAEHLNTLWAIVARWRMRGGAATRGAAEDRRRDGAVPRAVLRRRMAEVLAPAAPH